MRATKSPSFKRWGLSKAGRSGRRLLFCPFITNGKKEPKAKLRVKNRRFIARVFKHSYRNIVIFALSGK